MLNKKLPDEIISIIFQYLGTTDELNTYYSNNVLFELNTILNYKLYFIIYIDNYQPTFFNI